MPKLASSPSKTRVIERSCVRLPVRTTFRILKLLAAKTANELLNIKGIKASFVLTEYQGKIYVSARSIDEVNVQVIMERLGGGGHMNIAGCQMEGISVSEGIAKIKKCLSQMLEEGEIS